MSKTKTITSEEVAKVSLYVAVEHNYARIHCKILA
jgi:hypothetical protein